MKRLCAIAAAASLLGLFGCASEGPTSDELQEQLRKGVTGEGQVSEDVDRTDDPYVKPREGKPPPRE